MKKTAIVVTGLILVVVSVWIGQNRNLFACGTAAQGAAAVQSFSPKEADIKARIAGVENGLLTPVIIKGHPMRMKLAARMAFFKVPGVSIAMINHGRIKWARGFGLADVAHERLQRN